MNFFFFFKQKTAYEMRISDWSSDVCSSDLSEFRAQPRRAALGQADHRHRADRVGPVAVQPPSSGAGRARPRRNSRSGRNRTGISGSSDSGRSEEHTSELQSLMRISYAVFCLKKKNSTSINSKPYNCK